jgi:hypothetical protein
MWRDARHGGSIPAMLPLGKTEDESDSRAKSMLSCLLWLGRNRSALLGLVESS